MMASVKQVAQDGFDHAVRLAPDVDGFGKVCFGQRFEGGKENAPAFFPPLHDLGALVVFLVQELARALAVGFFTIGGQKIGPARDKVAAEVLE